MCRALIATGIGLLCLFVAGLSVAAEPIGTVYLAKGDVVARSADDRVRELTSGAPIYQGETVVTARRSVAVLEFYDESRIALQPSSEMNVKDYADMDEESSFVVELLRGALRTVTGEIAKRAPQTVRYEARGITVGIRGTTFVMRRCSQGAVSCEFSRAVSENGIIEENQAEQGRVRIYVREDAIQARREISREDYLELLGANYVWLLEGAIGVTTSQYIFDLEFEPQEVCDPQPGFPTSGKPCVKRQQNVNVDPLMPKTELPSPQKKPQNKTSKPRPRK